MSDCLRHDYVRPARLTTGEAYVGNQMFQGNGVLRHCIKCDRHKPCAGGQSRKRGTQRFFCCADCISLEVPA